MKNAHNWITATRYIIALLMIGLFGCTHSAEHSNADANNQDDENSRDNNATVNNSVEQPDNHNSHNQNNELICDPGEFLGCRTENTAGINRCSDDGTKIVPGSCESGQICRHDQCVDVGCIPGARRCGAGDIPQECDEQGEGFVDLEQCPDHTRCDEGFCLDQCELARVMNSYIGCEYWAVELENHLLSRAQDGSPTIPAEQRPPFAIVLANTSDSVMAQITITTSDGSLAQALGSRVVGTDTQMPGLDLVTVYSEVLDQAGNRLHGPLEGAIDAIPLPPNSVMTLILSHRSIPFGSSSLTDGAYKITSTYPVVAYQFNPLCCNYNYTNDASLLLPTGVLTGDYMYMGFEVWRSGSLTLPATLTVIATEDDTEVTIQLPPSKLAGRSFEEMIYPITDRERVEGPDDEGVISLVMQPYDVLNVAAAGISPNEDLTGARVHASRPVSVFGGHSCTNVPFNLAACDHLESQLFPMETWGNRFVAAPLKRRGQENQTSSREGTYWKFLAGDNDTRVVTGLNLSPPNVMRSAGGGVPFCGDLASSPESGIFHLQAGQSCEFGTKQLFVVEATKPVMMGAFLSGQVSVTETAGWGTHSGDPAFFLVPPQEQYRTSYSFLTPSTYWVSYVTVTIAPGFKLTLDGQELDPLDYDYELLSDGSMARVHIPVQDGPHTISAIVPFGIVVYGYDDFVSYAYTGGLDLKKISTFE